MARASQNVFLLVGVLLGAAALTGCTSASEVTSPSLERERTAADVLPGGMFTEDNAGSAGPEADTSRLVGEFEGANVYLAQARAQGKLCLIIVADVESAGASCGIPGQFSAGNGAIEVKMTSDGIVPVDDDGAAKWVVLSDDVVARKA